MTNPDNDASAEDPRDEYIEFTLSCRPTPEQSAVRFRMSDDDLLDLAHRLSDEGKLDQALAEYEIARARFVARGDLGDVADVDMNIGLVRIGEGRADEAVDLLESAAAVFEELGDDELLDTCRGNLLIALGHAHRYDEATQLATEVLARRYTAGASRELADALVNAANIDKECDKWELARERYVEAMEIYRQLDDHVQHADCLDALGVIARHDGLLTFAVSLHEEAISRYVAVEHADDLAIARYNLAVTQLRLGWFAEAAENARLATDVPGCATDPGLVRSIALDALGRRADASEFREAFRAKHGQECFDRELTSLS